MRGISSQSLHIGGSQSGSSKSRDSSVLNHATSYGAFSLEEKEIIFFTFQMWFFTKPTHILDQERYQNVPGGLLNDLTVQNLGTMFDRAQIWTNFQRKITKNMAAKRILSKETWIWPPNYAWNHLKSLPELLQIVGNLSYSRTLPQIQGFLPISEKFQRKKIEKKLKKIGVVIFGWPSGLTFRPPALCQNVMPGSCLDVQHGFFPRKFFTNGVSEYNA